MKRISAALVLTAILLTLAGCGGGGAATTTPASTPPDTRMPGTEVKVTGGSYWMITPAQLAAMARADFFLMNVDDPKTIVIAGTDLFVKLAEIGQNLDKLPADKDKKIVVYCIVGNKSRDASAELVARGYTRVMNLEGGTTRWQQQGYPAVPYTASP